MNAQRKKQNVQKSGVDIEAKAKTDEVPLPNFVIRTWKSKYQEELGRMNY